MSGVEEEEEGEMLEGMSASIPDGRQIQRKENDETDEETDSQLADGMTEFPARPANSIHTSL